MTEHDLDYKRTYSDLSKEFRNLYQTFWKTANLLPAMYNRLTLIDRYSHKDAINKIKSDHNDLPGFSARNIRRNLPMGNPHVPRRVRTSRPKSSQTESNDGSNLSLTKYSYLTENSTSIVDEKECPRCLELSAKNRELEEALQANSRFSPADSLLGSERVYSVPKKKEYLLTDAFKKSEQLCFIIFDSTGKFVYAEPDIEKIERETW